MSKEACRVKKQKLIMDLSPTSAPSFRDESKCLSLYFLVTESLQS